MPDSKGFQKEDAGIRSVSAGIQKTSVRIPLGETGISKRNAGIHSCKTGIHNCKWQYLISKGNSSIRNCENIFKAFSFSQVNRTKNPSV